MSDPLASTTLSYAAYAEIPADRQRWEFLDGEVFVNPAPSPPHQFTVQELWRFLDNNLAAFGDDAIAFVSPIDVILNDAEIVQPDVVVARREQVSNRGIEGAPPLLVEVLSPTRPSLDREVKGRRYAANGVERFWLVDPASRTMECFELVDGTYVPVATASGPRHSPSRQACASSSLGSGCLEDARVRRIFRMEAPHGWSDGRSHPPTR